MTAKQEIIAEPLQVYLRAFSGAAPAIPRVEDTPAVVTAAGWTLLGRNGRNSQKREGVKIATSVEFAEWMGANEIKVGDRWITKEDAEVSCTLCDLRMETLAVVLDQTVRTVADASNADFKELGFGRPVDVKRWSVLLRGRTPYADTAANDKWRQFLLWSCIVTSGYEEQPNRDTPGAVPFAFKPMVLDGQDEVKKYGVIRAWSAP